MNAKWVLGADIVPPAKPARRLSAHVPSSHEVPVIVPSEMGVHNLCVLTFSEIGSSL